MLTPLVQFICDTCGQVIDSPKNGWLEWIRDGPPVKNSQFNIIHSKQSSPLDTPDGCSQHERRPGKADDRLDCFVGIHATASLIPWLDVGPEVAETYSGPHVASMREWCELFKRLTLPHYEEARFYLGQAIADTSGEDLGNPLDYKSPNYLKWVVEQYSKF